MHIVNSVFVVTGAGDGIGREVTLQLLSRGARVAAVDLRDDRLRETSALAGTHASRLSTHVVNVSDRATVEALPAAVVDHHGQVDGVLNIAGIIQRFVPISELSIDEIEHVMNVNFWGTVYMTKAFLPLLIARPHAALVNVSSMGGLVPVPGQGAYGASKAAVKLLTETLYAELRTTNVSVTVVFPGGVGTRITENSGVDIPGAAAHGASTPEVTPVDDAAHQIVEALAKGTPRLLIGGDAKMLDRVSRISPTRAITMVADQMKKLLG